jgi:hypothetical protein
MCSWHDDNQYDRELAHKAARRAEEESELEQNTRRAPGPTFAEAQAGLARAISDLTEYIFAAPSQGNWLKHHLHVHPSPDCHLCKERS